MDQLHVQAVLRPPNFVNAYNADRLRLLTAEAYIPHRRTESRTAVLRFGFLGLENQQNSTGRPRV